MCILCMMLDSSCLFQKDIPVNKDIISLMESVQERQSFQLAHGGMVEGEDVLGRRNGKLGILRDRIYL